MFLIIENIKWNQKISIIKLHIIILLLSLMGSSFFQFLDEIGYRYILLISIFRLLGFFSLINFYLLIAYHKVKPVIYIIELIFLLLIIPLFYSGLVFLVVKDGVYNVNVNWFHKSILVSLTLALLWTMATCSIVLYKKTDQNNLYQLKINRWSLALLLSFFVFFISIVINIVLYKNVELNGIKPDTRIAHVIGYFILVLFILNRPKFLDEAGFSFSVKSIIPSKTTLTTEKFHFVFYANQYYLKPEAHIEDFSLILNFSKAEVIDYMKHHTEDNFNELVNRYRIKYFKDLLLSKKHESFTIEALSELSGFANRRTMYNAYKKYEGGSPTDFINSLK
jgi:AraC-like DNA-binding protein